MTLDLKIQVWNAVGTWLAGLATFSAVLYSLYLSRQASRIRLKASVGLRDLVGNGVPPQAVLQFSVTNLGERPVTISNIGWVVGKRKSKRYAIQLFGSHMSPDIPQTLVHGQRVDLLVYFGERPDWMADFAQDFIKSNERSTLKTLVVEFYTSVDQILRVKPEASFLAKLGAVPSSFRLHGAEHNSAI